MTHFKLKALTFLAFFGCLIGDKILAEEIPSLSNQKELTTFIDHQMTQDLAEFHLPGAVISIVKDNQVLYSQGYGMANIAENQPVHGDNSMFRIASTTKLFTWTAVMQLVEQGKIDLDTDINQYLTSLQIPDTFPEPITMRHLMTHTAGFEEGGVGYQITTDEKTLPASISDTLKKHPLARIRPAGKTSSYSNYGASLAGLIVEEVSGQAYDDYIQTHIFQPLKMTHATVVEPLPASFKDNQVLGYNYQGKEFVLGTPTFEGGFRPAGSGTVSATDMAQFMLAHLNQGKLGDSQLLQADTVKLMHQTAFRFDSRLPGSALGFQEGEINGQKTLSHAGADTMFITDLNLVPEQNLGIFLSYSGGDGDGALASMKTAFFDHYFPTPVEKKLTFLETSEAELAKLTGSFKFTRRNYSHIDKFFSLLTEMTVKQVDGKLAIGQGAEQELFGKVGDNLFQQIDGQHQIAFQTDENGMATEMSLSFIPDMPLEKTKLLDRSMFWLPLLGGTFIIFIITIFSTLIRIRRVRQLPRQAKHATWLAFATALTAVVTMVLTVTQVLNMDVLQRLSSVSLSLKLFLVLPLLLLGLTVLLLLKTIAVWRRQYFTLFGRILFTIVPIACLLLTWFFYYWNLIGWQFG